MNAKVSIKRRGFSLVEVVVAVGIMALGIVAVLGLLGPTSKSITEVKDVGDANRIISTVQSELQRLPFTDVIAYLKTAAQIAAETDAYDPSTDARALFASRAGDKVGLFASPVWNQTGLTAAERDGLKFFEISLIRNDTLSPVANDTTAGYLAFTIRLRWPAYLPNGERVANNAQKSVMIVPAAITR